MFFMTLKFYMTTQIFISQMKVSIIKRISKLCSELIQIKMNIMIVGPFLYIDFLMFFMILKFYMTLKFFISNNKVSIIKKMFYFLYHHHLFWVRYHFPSPPLF